MKTETPIPALAHTFTPVCVCIIYEAQSVGTAGVYLLLLLPLPVLLFLSVFSFSFSTFSRCNLNSFRWPVHVCSIMGQLFSSLWTMFSPHRPYKLLILGLNNAGKTSILYHLQLGHRITTQPTLGGNTEQLTITNPHTSHTISFTCWDLGGQEQLRESWRLYYEHTDAVLFVVDAADPARFPTAKRVLHRLLTEEPALKESILLVFANKQDVSAAASPAELMEVLELGKFKDRTWTLMGSSAATGESLREGMNWIAENLNGR